MFSHVLRRISLCYTPNLWLGGKRSHVSFLSICGDLDIRRRDVNTGTEDGVQLVGLGPTLLQDHAVIRVQVPTPLLYPLVNLDVIRMLGEWGVG
ncbi:hypothetical protein AVEN_255137-1 [Araneus ventricosus]|uniref:Uncharacterized protein n=1 Tax=Araneus ventricosus TaxID=182803 RepID=A0A4Y2BB15_ARAVE|nr:hypothetical protein AVEN_255137-1 [Araneus ventricosus]